jgi:hypothetical protein
VRADTRLVEQPAPNLPAPEPERVEPEADEPKLELVPDPSAEAVVEEEEEE